MKLAEARSSQQHVQLQAYVVIVVTLGTYMPCLASVVPATTGVILFPRCASNHKEKVLSSLVQGRQTPQRERLRLEAQRLSRSSAPLSQAPEAFTSTRPGWLLLFFDLCLLAGILLITLYISWVYDHLPAGDPAEYHSYAVAFWLDTPRFVSFPKEYPPLSLIPFSFTLFPPSETHYYWVFAGWMAVIVGASYVWLARSASRDRAMIYVLYLVVGATGTLLMRFDLLPALVTLGALMLAERKRFLWAYVLLAVGVLLKIYPVFLVPVLMAAQWREVVPAPTDQQGASRLDWLFRLRLAVGQIWRALTLKEGRPGWEEAQTLRRQLKPLLVGLGTFSGLIVLGMSIPAIFNLEGTFSVLGYNLFRPIQIESVPATLLWLGSFLGFPVTPNHSYVSLNLVGPLDVVLKPLSLLGLVAGTLLVCRRVLQGQLSLGQAFVASIALVLVTNKLLSPQYLMWVLPLVAYVEGFDLLWLVICALTTLIFPFIYQTRHPILTVPDNPAFLPTIAVRNLLLCIATLRTLRQRTEQPALAPAKAAKEFNALKLAQHGPVTELTPLPLEPTERPGEGQPDRPVPSGR